jgi:NAD(P)-dependent dehydrogenase (short-subunit alcohol dehydrogenase family)
MTSRLPPVAVVAGGAGGIGRGMVAALSERGYRVASLDLRPNAGAALSIEADLTEEEPVGDAIARVRAELGVPAALVCASGLVSESPFADLPTAEWSRIIDASLTTAFLLCRAVIPVMAAAGHGSVVTMSSGWGRKGYPFGAPYAAAKSGVEALTKSLALEYAANGVRVNAIAPGPIRTAMVSDNPAFDEDAKVAVIPMGRLGEVDDVVLPALFLLGDGARYITGQVVHVNGGLLLP